jgi:hypothetical protein
VSGQTVTRAMRPRRSHCWRCEQPILVGQRIARLGRVWVHVACVPSVVEVRRATPDVFDDRSPIQ